MKPITREVIAIEESFFNDGHWYLLTSNSLGGRGLDAQSLEAQLQSNTPQVILDLVKQGISLPLFFEGDCVLDNAIIVIGELTEQENNEWLGRIQGQLNITCGEFLITGGFLAEDLEVALNHDKAPNPNFNFFQKIKVPAGQYLVEIYAFLSSMSASFIWEKLENTQAIIDQWQQSGVIMPKWLDEFINQEDCVNSNEFDLQDYIIRLTPLKETVALPELITEVNCFGKFAVRLPNTMPLGISRRQLLAEAAKS